MKKRCECCRKELKNIMGGQKYCNSCSVYLKDLRKKISSWRYQARRLRKIVYGQEMGGERVR